MSFKSCVLAALFLCVSCHFSGAESTAGKKSIADEHDLPGLYGTFVQQRRHGSLSQSEFALKQFQQQLLAALKNDRFENTSFEMVDPYYPITVVESEDKVFALVSWDELNGGTWHLYNSAFRYRDKGVLHSGLFRLDDTDALTFTDARNFKIQTLPEQKYLVSAYGTHGHGHDFYTLRLVHFDGGKMVDCNGCFDGQDRFVFYKPRALKAVPEYNEKNKTLRYPELKPVLIEGEDSGFSKATGNTITLVFSNGVFTQQLQ